MNSILVKDEYIKCPNCSNTIRSAVPECTKCGLMTGEEGVRELAAIDERNFLANADADDALLYANAPSAFLALAYVLSRFVPEFGVTFLFASAIGLTMFWWKFLRWHQTYSEIQFPDELFTEAQYKVKRAGVLGLIGSTLLIAFIYTRFINV